MGIPAGMLPPGGKLNYISMAKDESFSLLIQIEWASVRLV